MGTAEGDALEHLSPVYVRAAEERVVYDISDVCLYSYVRVPAIGVSRRSVYRWEWPWWPWPVIIHGFRAAIMSGCSLLIYE